jgi:DNA-3-methyladenine glycosylase II
MSDIYEALKFLKKNDTALAEIIDQKDTFKLKSSDNYFKDLVSTIISQQLSFKVYATLEKRVFDKLNNKIEPETVLELPDEVYRACGISGSKTAYIKNLAEFYKVNKSFFKKIVKLEDEEIIEQLTKIKGIGVWSAQMFLIFNLGRLNVFPIKDGGIRAAVKKLYKFKKDPTDKQMLKIASKWGDYKTIATWYLWRYLENR